MSSVTWVRRQRALQRFWSEFRMHRAGMVGLAILLVAVVLALIAPLFIDAGVTNVVSGTREKMAPPSIHDPLGTDESGRSVLLMIWWGSRTSLLIARHPGSAYLIYGVSWCLALNGVGAVLERRGAPGRVDSMARPSHALPAGRSAEAV